MTQRDAVPASHNTQCRPAGRTWARCCAAARRVRCPCGTVACPCFLGYSLRLKLLRKWPWVDAVANCDQHIGVPQLFHVRRASSERLKSGQLKVSVHERDAASSVSQHEVSAAGAGAADVNRLRKPPRTLSSRYLAPTTPRGAVPGSRGVRELCPQAPAPTRGRRS